MGFSKSNAKWNLKKPERKQINNLTLHLKQLEKEEMRNPKVLHLVEGKEIFLSFLSRRKKILKIRAEINAKETKETIAKINKAKGWFFERIKKKKRETISQTHQETKGEESNQEN